MLGAGPRPVQAAFVTDLLGAVAEAWLAVAALVEPVAAGGPTSKATLFLLDCADEAARGVSLLAAAVDWEPAAETDAAALAREDAVAVGGFACGGAGGSAAAEVEAVAGAAAAAAAAVDGVVLDRDKRLGI